MLVFVDDAGDAGFKLERGSSKYFVIACVIFDDNLDAEETALKIKRLRRNLGWRDDQEFKFNKSNRKIRSVFLQEITNCKFRVRAIVADKSQITSTVLKQDKNKFYNYMIKEVLSKSARSVSDASIRLDGHEDREYKKAANAYFRKHVNQKGNVVKDFRFVDSRTNSLIQLADMVAGSLLRTTQDSKTDQFIYKRIIDERIEDIWYFT